MNALRTSIRVFLTYCHKAGYAPSDAGRLIRRALSSPPPPRTLSAEEKVRLLAALGAAPGFEAARDLALIRLLLETGIRVGAALSVDLEGLDLARGEIAIQSKRGHRGRLIIPGDLARHFATFIAGRFSGPLFTTQGGRRMSIRHARRRFAHWLRLAGIQHAAVHAARHTFAMGLYRKTRDIALVKAALHHRSIASTLVYAEADQDDLRRALG
jgi:site-specific recombinase XerD